MEHEIASHTRKIVKIVRTPGEKLLKKLAEVGMEVGIIVFAVLLAGGVHHWQEEQRKADDVKHFLLGLRRDLKKDEPDLLADRQAYAEFHKGYAYVLSTNDKSELDRDSVKKYYGALLGSRELIINNGRYEGFKSTGLLSNIENQDLQDRIVKLYEVDIPALRAQSGLYNSYKVKMFDENINLLVRNLKTGESNFADIIYKPKMRNLFSYLAHTAEIVNGYDSLIVNYGRIQQEIAGEYGMHGNMH